MAGGYGKRFEANFQKSCQKDGLLIERFQDSNKSNAVGTGNSRFTLQSPCDYFIFDGQYLYYLELKSSETGSVSFPMPLTEKTDKTVSIKPNQIKALLERIKYPNVLGGIIIDFKDRTTKTQTIKGGCYYIDIKSFCAWAEECNKRSINLHDAQVIGIEIPRTLKKVNYSYDFKSIIKTIVRR